MANYLALRSMFTLKNFCAIFLFIFLTINYGYSIITVQSGNHESLLPQFKEQNFFPNNDSIKPTILNVNFIPTQNTFPYIHQNITIKADVTDSSGIYLVNLSYQENGGSWITVPMKYAPPSRYDVIIGPFTDSVDIEIYITAMDNSPNHNLAIADNNGQYYFVHLDNFDLSTTSGVLTDYNDFIPILGVIIVIGGMIFKFCSDMSHEKDMKVYMDGLEKEFRVWENNTGKKDGKKQNY